MVPRRSSPPSSSAVLVSPASAVPASAVAAAVSGPPSLHAQLLSCQRSGDLARASSLSRELEAQGGKFTHSWINMWIVCHEKSRDWQGAERLWTRMPDLKLTPDGHSYRALIQVYTSAGGEQLAKIDPLLVQMAGSSIRFSARVTTLA